MSEPEPPADEALTRAARFLFSPRGRLAPRPYAIAAGAIIGISYIIYARYGFAVPDEGTGPAPLALLIVIVLRFWMLAALSIKRTADAGLSGWIALLAVLPAADVFLAITLGAAPRRLPPDGGDTGSAAELPALSWQRQRLWFSVGIGVLLVLGAVALGALVLGRYGLGLFVYAPFMIGATTAYFANLGGDVGLGTTLRVQLVLAAVAGLVLIVTALEGLLCLLLLMPLALPIMVLGASFGHAMAAYLHRSILSSVTAPALLVMILVLEQFVPVGGAFHSTHTVDIDAPVSRVWKALVDMEPMTEPPALPFLLGIAYPVDAELLGHRTGAARIGRFSTGPALERVTVWQPGRELAFEVLREPPSMVEMSFYDTVHAPHVHGFFVTRGGTFRLIDLGHGRTRLWERTEHELHLEPLGYWLPLARWMVGQNNERVLRHVRRQAEAPETAATTASARSAPAARAAPGSRWRTPRTAP